MIHSKATVKSWTALFGSQGCLFLLALWKLGSSFMAILFVSLPGTGTWEDRSQKSCVWALLSHSSCPLIPGNSSYSVPCLISLWSLPLSCLQGGRWQADLAENKDSYPWLPPVSLCVPALSCCPPSTCLIDTARPLGRGFFYFYFFPLKKILWFLLWLDGLCLMFNFSTPPFLFILKKCQRKNL